MTNSPQTAIAIFVVVLVVGLAIISLWPASRKERARQQREEAGIAARAALISTLGTTFHAGAMAAIDGTDWKDNPHCEPGGHQGQSVEWHCGWVHGRKLLRQHGGQP